MRVDFVSINVGFFVHVDLLMLFGELVVFRVVVEKNFVLTFVQIRTLKLLSQSDAIPRDVVLRSEHFDVIGAVGVLNKHFCDARQFHDLTHKPAVAWKIYLRK